MARACVSQGVCLRAIPPGRGGTSTVFGGQSENAKIFSGVDFVKIGLSVQLFLSLMSYPGIRRGAGGVQAMVCGQKLFLG